MTITFVMRVNCLTHSMEVLLDEISPSLIPHHHDISN